VKQPVQERPDVRVGPSGRAALHLLACCPRMPTDVVAVLLGMRHARSAAQLLTRLRGLDLARYQIARLGPIVGSQPTRLWAVTPAGQAVLTGRGLGPSLQDAAQLPYGEPERWPKTVRQRDLPMLIAAYQLLAELVGEVPQPARLGAWEHPWIRGSRPAEGGRKRLVRLPAAAVLTGEHAEGSPLLRLLLVPDVGTAPLASYRGALRGLIELRQAAGIGEDDEPVVVVGVATPRDRGSRAEAWRSLLQQIAHKAGDRPLRARVLTLQTRVTRNNQRLVRQVDEIFALVARHPLLTRHQLAGLLGTSAPRIARLVTGLVERGWVRPIQLENQPPATVGATHHEIQRLGLVELTPAGRREAARRLLLNAGLARRRHGLVHGDAAMHRFLRHIRHTLGGNAFFVALAAAATHVSRRGVDEALVEWRSAAACARGRFRPDGYGCYRRGASRYGFFLEYDRGTERLRQYAAKLATYYRYRDSGAYLRDYQSFPTLLVVTTSAAAETRLAHQAHLAQEHYGTAPLRVFLTTTARIDAYSEGVLGPIWRAPGLDAWAERLARVRWLPGLPRAPAAKARDRQGGVWWGDSADRG
jgi:hypothetical protein